MRLGVNIDHVATVRQARRGQVPDPVEAALVCEAAGADSIVCHLREDRRHIQDQDVRRLKRALRIPLNLEMSIARSVLRTALAVRPAQVTLVPEHRQELTTVGGLDAAGLSRRLNPIIRVFQQNGIAVSLFVDPIGRQVEAAHRLGVETIELHTGAYANAAIRARPKYLATLRAAARLGRSQGLFVAAGHGLDYGNVAPVMRIPEIEELNIGFSIITRALFVGLSRAVSDMTSRLGGRRGYAVRRRA